MLLVTNTHSLRLLGNCRERRQPVSSHCSLAGHARRVTKASSSPAGIQHPLPLVPHAPWGCGAQTPPLGRGPVTQLRRAGSGGKGRVSSDTQISGKKLTLLAAPPTRSLSVKPQSRRRAAGNSTPLAAAAAISVGDGEDMLPGS